MKFASVSFRWAVACGIEVLSKRKSFAWTRLGCAGMRLG
jgi:hypothetical protein